MPSDYRVVAIRPSERVQEKRHLHYFEGICAESAGTTAIAMQRLEIPPGARAEPHAHDGYETAIYVLQGRVETRYGDELECSVISEAGDFLFLPPYVHHQPCNLSDTEVAVAVISRSNPHQREPVIPYVAK